MKRLAVGLAAAFFMFAASATAALAQGVMPWYGAATVGHAAAVNGSGGLVTGLRDAGSASGACALNFNCGISDLPLIPQSPGDLNGTFNPLAIYDNQPSTGNYHSWVSGYVGGVATENLSSLGTATAPSKQIVVNGVTVLGMTSAGATAITQPPGDNTTKIATDAFVTSAIGTIGGVPLPYVATNTALIALATTPIPGKVIRGGVTAPGDAPPQLFISETGSCTANGFVNDVGHCNNASDGNSWVAPIGPQVDVREFGASTGASDNAGAINAALTAVSAAGGGVVVIPAVSTPFLVTSATISVPGNVTLYEPRGATAGLKLGSGAFSLVTLTGAYPKIVGVYGDANGFAAAAFAFADTSTYGSIDDVHAKGSSGGSTVVADISLGITSDHASVTNSHIEGGANGIGGGGDFTTGSVRNPTNFTIAGNTIWNQTYHAINASCVKCAVHDNWIYAGTGGQTNLITMYCCGNVDVAVYGNHIQSNVTAGCIRVQTIGGRIDDNTCDGDAIALDGATFDERGGTFTWTNGSNIVTGTGTKWAHEGFANNLSSGAAYDPAGNTFVVKQIDSDTQVELTANYTGTTQTCSPTNAYGSAKCTLFGGVLSQSVSIRGNTVENSTTEGIQVADATAIVLGNNHLDNNNTGTAGILLSDASAITISGGATFGFNDGLEIFGSAGNTGSYSTGTITATAGSATVTGSGTAWSLAIPTTGNAYFQIQTTNGRLVLPIAVSAVASDTSLRLASVYPAGEMACPSGGCAYRIVWGINTDITVSGGRYSGVANSIHAVDSQRLRATGMSGAAPTSVAEGGITYDNVYSSCTMTGTPGLQTGGSYYRCDGAVPDMSLAGDHVMSNSEGALWDNAAAAGTVNLTLPSLHDNGGAGICATVLAHHGFTITAPASHALQIGTSSVSAVTNTGTNLGDSLCLKPAAGLTFVATSEVGTGW